MFPRWMKVAIGVVVIDITVFVIGVVLATYGLLQESDTAFITGLGMMQVAGLITLAMFGLAMRA